MKRYYKGWSIFDRACHPITGRWVAFRYGVRVCARTESELIEILDLK